MKYKNQIWEYYIKYAEEYDCYLYSQSNGRDHKPFFDSMELDIFHQRRQIFRWLDKYNFYFHNVGDEEFIKPSKSSIIEAMQLMAEEGRKLLERAKIYKNQPQIRKDLTNTAKKRIACSEYYIDLAEAGFFEDKHVKGIWNEVLNEVSENEQ